jgi:eukaryotic-like serine/threonine-protein kinase
MNDHCPRCGSLRSEASQSEFCPRCSTEEGPDADATLAESIATRVPRSVLDALSREWDSMPRILLPDSRLGEEQSPVVQVSSAEMPGRGERSSKIQLLGEIARGGMGAVLKGRDPDLGRDLAVKVLLEAHRDNPDLIRRFVEEAQISGQLQHPGIVPVYELGAFGDSRPYFTMKLVKGRTLSGLLSDRLDPAQDRTRFLEMFLKVAEAVAYAHSRWVIHRDLKPSNVMVGSFGEVQVMDWGLAKVLPRGGATDDAGAGREKPDHETVIATARSETDSDLSRAGSVLGTPSYMAPEQARGEVDLIDRRVDVFALGSILAEILTGKPAFTGRSTPETIRKAARGDLSEAVERLKASDADADLVALALACLAPEPEDRPADAQVLVHRLSRHRNSIDRRLREAELAQAAEYARAEEAKRTAAAEVARAEAAEARTRAERQARSLQLGLAASILGLMALGAGGYAWNQRQQAGRIDRTSRAINADLAEAVRLRDEAVFSPAGDLAKWAEALSAAQKAEAALKLGDADNPLRDLVTEILSKIDRERAAAIVKAHRLEIDRNLMAALEQVRGNRAEHGKWQRTDAEYASAFVKAGIDIDNVGPAEARRWLAARSERVEVAGYLDDWADIRRRSGRSEADWRPLVAAAMNADPDPWRRSLREKAGAKDAAALAEFRRLADDEKALDLQPAVSLVLLASQLKNNTSDRDRAIRVLRRACFLHPGDFWANFELAKAFGVESGRVRDMYPRPEESVRHLTAAAALRARSDWAHHCLGMALNAQGNLEQAVSELQVAIRLSPENYWAHNSLGNVFKDQAKLKEAEAEYRATLTINPNYEAAHNNLGLVFKDLGQPDKAIEACQAALRINHDYYLAHENLGDLFHQQGKLDKAIEEFQAALRINPASDSARKNLGDVLKDQGQPFMAIAAYEAALLTNPANDSAYNSLGDVLYEQGNMEKAMEKYRAALHINPAYDMAHNSLGFALMAQGKLEEAVYECQDALVVNPKNLGAHVCLGAVLLLQGKLNEADAECQKALHLDPNSAAAHLGLGAVLLLKKDYAGSRKALLRCRELGSTTKEWTAPLAAQFRQLEELLARVERLPALLKGDDKPKDATEALAFAQLCYDEGRHGVAARLWGEALSADPKLGEDRAAGYRYNAACAAALAAGGTSRDEPALDEPARVEHGRKALDWLKAELATWNKVLESGLPESRLAIVQTFQHWRNDSDLASVRDVDAIAKLPEAEQASWRRLWEEVGALQKRAEQGRP